MDIDKLNTVALKIAGIVIGVFLVIGGIGACVNHQYLKGAVGLLVTPIIVYIGFRPASLKTWALLIIVFFITMYLVGLLGN